MSEGLFSPPPPVNEPVRSYAPGSPERAALKARYAEMREQQIEIPLRIGAERVNTGKLADVCSPHEHSRVLARFHKAGAGEVRAAIDAATAAREAWANMPWQDRAAIFLKAADLLAGPYRDTLNAATMWGQSKNVMQAEVDSACELIDFWRFNVSYMAGIYAEQPPANAPGTWNRLDHRPLDGFVFAVTPFNFTAIAGNLPTAPAMMGNTVLWKPASTQVLAAHYLMDIFEEAGLPPGVINFIPGSGAEVGDPTIDSPEFAGIHFTGSTGTFHSMWKRIGGNIERYRAYPRIVGETGGKDFIFAHASAELDALVTATVRGAFEYQGQKCSAASRVFIPASLWDAYIERLQVAVSEIRMGPPDDYSNFMCAVIDRAAFSSITSYIEFARSSDDHQIIIGGSSDDSVGYFIEPTVVVADSPTARLMVEEIFGPVVTLYRYEDADMEQTIAAMESAASYALTGAIFARDRGVIGALSEALRFAAGNFYINDKPTGAVVGQQPFGGSRASGTNDKAGSALNLLRWVSPRAIKETFVPPKDFRYPHMSES
jgi:1-pyrroline-5-carboxylate dehydrogenase